MVCFLPSEALFSAALEADPSLIEFSTQNNVVMATPTTLIALLRAVEFGWQQMEITKNAKAIHEMGKKIYEKLVVAQGHVTRLGNALGNSVDHYNRFIGSIEGKGGAFSYGRQLGELAHADGELAEVAKLRPEVREMESQEWSQPLLGGGVDLGGRRTYKKCRNCHNSRTAAMIATQRTHDTTMHKQNAASGIRGLRKFSPRSGKVRSLPRFPWSG